MRLAGDFDFDHHNFKPGQAIFSSKINKILSGDCTEWGRIPSTSAFGAVFNILTHYPRAPWDPELFPDVAKIFADYAASKGPKGVKAQWGFVQLSLGEEHSPSIPPLRAAFELRRAVLRVAGFSSLSRTDLSTISVLALTKLLVQLRGNIDDSTALALALETLNAMAKTAPVLQKHINEFAAGETLIPRNS
jgi:hypothetical protein